MKKIIIFLFILFLLFNNIVMASGNRPSVSYPHSLGDRAFDRYVYEPKINTFAPINPSEFNANFFYLDRGFGLGKNELILKVKIDSLHEMKMKEQQSLQGNDLLSFALLDPPGNTYFPPVVSKAVYIFEQSQVIGYLFLDPLTITTFGFTQTTDPFVTGVRSLPINNNFLNGNLIIPVGASVTFYEKRIGSFIERYGILNISDPDEPLTTFILESFYPESMETDFSNIIIKNLNKNIQRIYLDYYLRKRRVSISGGETFYVNTPEGGELYLQEVIKYLPNNVNLDEEYDF